MQSLWHRALNKCLWSLLFHVALLFIFPKCPPSSYKPTKFLLVLPNRPWLSPPERGHSHPPSSPLAAGAPLLVPLYGSLCWIVNLRALSPQKRSWHGVGRQPVKAWKSKWVWRNSSVNFIQLISSNGRKWVEANEWAVTPTNSEFKKLAWKRRVIFLRSCAFKKTSRRDPKQQGC